MKKSAHFLLCLLTGILLCALSGCSLLPPLGASQDEAPAVLTLPEDMALAWDPAAAAVETVEITVSEGGADGLRTVTVTIRMAPGPS